MKRGKLRRELRWQAQKLRHFIFGRLVPFEVEMRRKSGWVSTYWLSSFYGAYRASRYFQNDPLPAIYVCDLKCLERAVAAGMRGEL